MTTPPAGPQEARDVLASVEFVHGICPACSGSQPDHDDDCRIAAALSGAAVRGGAPAALREAAEDVRYAGGNGTSDYWRGFNDGIDKLAARLLSESTVDSLDELAKDVIDAAREVPEKILSLFLRRGIVIDKWPPADIPPDGWTEENFAALDAEVRWQAILFTVYTMVIGSLATPVREYDEYIARLRVAQPLTAPQRGATSESNND